MSHQTEIRLELFCLNWDRSDSLDEAKEALRIWDSVCVKPAETPEGIAEVQFIEAVSLREKFPGYLGKIVVTGNAESHDPRQMSAWIRIPDQTWTTSSELRVTIDGGDASTYGDRQYDDSSDDYEWFTNALKFVAGFVFDNLDAAVLYTNDTQAEIECNRMIVNIEKAIRELGVSPWSIVSRSLCQVSGDVADDWLNWWWAIREASEEWFGEGEKAFVEARNEGALEIQWYDRPFSICFTNSDNSAPFTQQSFIRILEEEILDLHSVPGLQFLAEADTPCDVCLCGGDDESISTLAYALRRRGISSWYPRLATSLDRLTRKDEACESNSESSWDWPNPKLIVVLISRKTQKDEIDSALSIYEASDVFVVLDADWIEASLRERGQHWTHPPHSIECSYRNMDHCRWDIAEHVERILKS